MIRRVNNRVPIFSQISNTLGISKSNSVEYLLTKPQWKRIISLNSSMNPYGHSLIQYDHPILGKTVMNICGQHNKDLVNFFRSEDYLFTDEMLSGNEQGGIFNRSFIGTRIEDLDPELITRLHSSYEQLAQQHHQGRIRFSLANFLFSNHIRSLFDWPEGGNCAYWTSKGLQKVGLLEKPSGFPMFLLLKLLLQQKDLDRINIVSYRSINYDHEPKWTFIHPVYRWFIDLRDFYYFDKFANVVVKPFFDERLGEYRVDIVKKDHVRDQWLALKKKFSWFF